MAYKKKVPVIGIRKSDRFLLHGTSLASVECLSLPLVQEIVLSADIRCSECQKRIAEIMSRMSESVVVNVLDKKVALTCRYPIVAKEPARQVPAIRRNPLNKVALLKRIFRSPQS
ncbi:uncharacterized protein LOC21393331 isoform X2 [Morus notabilis]|uniref:uncharacterized protein LOC21393331 isoform X2 n=1 Tax=Morus notabilis TaxID=981085 RepID=UPI000CED0E1F|nr:uncharacterized protein LOC21393331 isoform X2 [Morus notabilis]